MFPFPREDTIREFNAPCRHFISDHHVGMSAGLEVAVSLLLYLYSASTTPLIFYFEDSGVDNERKPLRKDEINTRVHVLDDVP